MSEDKEEEKVLMCYHCSNETLMKKIAEYEKKFGEEALDYCYVKLFYCPVCQEETLLEEWVYLNMRDEEGYPISDNIIVYPQVRTDMYSIPKSIKASYESALKVRKIDQTICFMALRKTLELIVNEQNASGANLEKKILDLANKGIFPSQLKDASDLARLFGNEAVHSENINSDIYKNELNIMFEFIELIVNYIYIIPEKISKAQATLTKIKEKNNG